MSDHADIVRRALAFARRAAAENPRMGWRVDGLGNAFAALDALVAERDEALRAAGLLHPATAGAICDHNELLHRRILAAEAERDEARRQHDRRALIAGRYAERAVQAEARVARLEEALRKIVHRDPVPLVEAGSEVATLQRIARAALASGSEGGDA